MTPSVLRLFALVGALAGPLSAQTTTTLLNDTFTDNERATQSLPTSSKWMTSGSAGTADNLDASSGALVAKNTLTHLTYFTAENSPVNLAIGDSLTVSFDVSFSIVHDTPGVFRVGLFNSGGHRFTGDNIGNTNAAFATGYDGYLAAVNVGQTAGNNNIFNLRERTATNNLTSGSIGGSGGFSNLGSGGAAKTFAANTVYNAVLTFTLVDASTLAISQSYSGLFAGDTVVSTASATLSDTASLTTSFDTLSFYYQTSNTDFTTIDNIKIDYTSTIPEPSAFAAFAGLGGLACVAFRRRRAA